MGERTQAWVFSVAVHLVLLALIGVSLGEKPEPLTPVSAPAERMIQAVAVDSNKVNAELAKIRAERSAKQKAEAEHKRKLQEQARRAAADRKAEQRRLAKLKAEAKRQQAAAQKAEKDRQAKMQAAQAAEAKRLAELKAQQAAEQKRLDELAKQRAAEQAAAQKAKEEQERRAREQQLKAQMAAEQQRLDAERQRQLKVYQAQYEALIRDKVQRNWSPPPGASNSFQCVVLVDQIPGGAVVSARIINSCGNPALDRSVVNAVQKASPLPSPPDPAVFDREIQFTFYPAQ